jgi:hypothetical protein
MDEEPGSSVSIMSGYGLEDRAIGVRSPAGAKIFSLTSMSRPALGPTQSPVQWVPGVLSPGVKRGRGVTLTTHHHLVPRSEMSRSYTSTPPQEPAWRVAELLCFIWMSNDLNFYMVLCENIALEQNTSLIHDLLCTCSSIKRRKTNVSLH